MKIKMIFNEARTLEDIVFENRNKAYGAYAMNRHCWKYLLIAFFITLAGVSTSVAVPFLKAMNNPGFKWAPGNNIQIIVEKIRVDPDLPIPPPPPPLPENLIKQSRYIVPVIVEEAPEGPEIGSMGDLVEKTVNNPVPDEFPTVDKQPKVIDEPVTDYFLDPEEHASFMNGDLAQFRNWVEANIVYPEIAIEHQIFGKVIVGFCVNAKGQVVDITVIRGVDPSLDQETIRVISSSPTWRAARQGGIPVKEKFTIPVVFSIN